MRVAFAGLRHGHIFALYDMVQKHPMYQITGAFEENEEARKAAEEKGVCCRYASYAELLADPDVDAVAMGGCYGDRGQMAVQALLAGKHVMADKPLCTSLSQLDEIEAAAKQSGKCVSCMFTMRFEPKILAVRQLIQSGALGRINNITLGGQHPLQYGRRPGWYFEEGKHGGVINDIAIHAVDVLPFAFGLEADTIHAARCWNCYADQEPGFADSAQFMLSSRDGAGILGDVSYAIPDGVEFDLPYYWQFYVWGTRGTMRFAVNEETTQYYIKGEKEPRTLENVQPETDYLSDFLRLVNGEKDVVLPMEQVFASTRKTLQMQAVADRT